MPRLKKVGPALCAVACLLSQVPPMLAADHDGHSHSNPSTTKQSPDDPSISLEYARSVAARVNTTVSKDFFDGAVVEGPWRSAYERLEKSLANEKTAPRTLIALDHCINEAMQSLKTSHSQFECLNDETFFFLHSLFGTLNHRLRTGPQAWARPIACTGMATGGCGFEPDQVRYVLDGSPAAKAGLIIGDHIKQVDSRPYVGYLNFLNRAGHPLKLFIERPGDGAKELELTPVKSDLYTLYVEATRASKKKIKQGKYTIGYIHLWSGGGASIEAMTEIVTQDFKDVDGLILDIRDGYGAASFEDLDLFYRPRAAFPDCISKDRAGKVSTDRMVFDKPVVALINSGSRSGKELLAYSFKSSGRARLVGENTAGAVVAGRLYPLDGKCALYLAVADISLEGKQRVRLEGLGVAPDITIINKNHDQIGYGLQLSSAIEALEKQLASQN